MLSIREAFKGNWELGIGNWALGIGNWELGIQIFVGAGDARPYEIW